MVLKVFKEKYKHNATIARASAKLKKMTTDRMTLNNKLRKMKVKTMLIKRQIANNRKMAAKLQANEHRSRLRTRK